MNEKQLFIKQLFIETKQVATLTNKTDRYARKDMRRCRAHFKLKVGQEITFQQYAEYKQVPLELILQILFG